MQNASHSTFASVSHPKYDGKLLHSNFLIQLSCFFRVRFKGRLSEHFKVLISLIVLFNWVFFDVIYEASFKLQVGKKSKI